jgi:hypothetical protein
MNGNSHMRHILIGLTLMSFLIGIYSCDVTSTFSVYNNSNERKLVEVVGIKQDSVYLERRFTKGDTARVAVQSQNISKPSFTFYLEPKQTAWLEYNMGVGYNTRQVIVSGKDTIQTIQTIWKSNKPPKNKYLVRKRKFYPIMGGHFQVALN